MYKYTKNQCSFRGVHLNKAFRNMLVLSNILEGKRQVRYTSSKDASMNSCKYMLGNLCRWQNE